jgi:polar amino acid transport system ATP-binding protein
MDERTGFQPDWSTSPLIEVRNAHLAYGEVKALRGVELEVRPHQVTALIGPSGSGKSSLLRCINLMAFIDEGSVRIAGQDLIVSRDGKHQFLLSEKERDRMRTHIGMVFQHFNLYPHLSVLRNVTLGPCKVLKKSREEAEAEARHQLARVGLAHKAAAMPRELSGGQKQRVAIARALAMRPKVMLFDEATSALDPEMVGEVIDIMKQLADEGMTMITATHEMDFALDVADRVVFMADGRVVEAGSARQVLEQPREVRTQMFLDRVLRRGATATPTS